MVNIKSNLKHTPQDLKERAYQTLVCPLMEYSCTCSVGPYTKGNVQRLEMVQCRAARYTLNRYHDCSSVTGMLSHLQWEPLQLCRLYSKLCMVYKSIHDIACIPIYEYLEPKPRMTKHDFQFQVPNTRVDCYK